MKPSRVISVLAGLAAALVALAVAELLAGLNRAWRSPVLDVGDRVIDAAPPFVKEFAIDTFGTNDKPALLIGIGVVLVVYAGIVGLIALRRHFARRCRRRGPVRGDRCVGGAESSHRPAVARGAAQRDRRSWPGSGRCGSCVSPCASGRNSRSRGPEATDRREFLRHSGVLLAGLAATAAVVGVAGRWLGSRFAAAASRAGVTLPRPATPLAPVPPSTQVDVPGMTPFITPNDRFYRIDTALTAPQVPTDSYTLRIKGMVDNELELSFDDLLRREMIERDITLTCVSNEVGGKLVGTARWLGTRLDALLRGSRRATGCRSGRRPFRRRLRMRLPRRGRA